MRRIRNNRPAAARKSDRPLFPFPPPGEGGGGRVPPTPRTLPARQKRWQATMQRLPPQGGFQNAPLKSPLRDPPSCCLRRLPCSIIDPIHGVLCAAKSV